MPITAQLKAFASGVFSALVVFYAGDVAQAQGAVLVVAFELRLDFFCRVIQDQVVASAGCAVAAFWSEFAAAKPRQCRLSRQLPRRQVVLVVNSASAYRQVCIAAYEVNDDFLTYPGNVHGSQLVTSPA